MTKFDIVDFTENSDGSASLIVDTNRKFKNLLFKKGVKLLKQNKLNGKDIFFQYETAKKPITFRNIIIATTIVHIITENLDKLTK
jgi:hypothetical protein